jgi:C1A family cysteine protease
MAVNQFTDMTQEEFESTILMPAVESVAVEEDFVQVGDVNWVTAGAVQAVKDQGRCGSCWAFAAVAVAESFKFLDTGVLGLFSDQQVTSCDRVSSGCNGGWHHWALTYMASAGICT